MALLYINNFVLLFGFGTIWLQSSPVKPFLHVQPPSSCSQTSSLHP